MTETETFKGLLGRTYAGDRVYVQVELRHMNDGRTRQSTEHADVTAYTELSVCGLVVEKGRRTVSSGGQVDEIAEVTAPAQGLSLADVRAIGTAWRRWHLNGMSAGCAHQTVRGRHQHDA